MQGNTEITPVKGQWQMLYQSTAQCTSVYKWLETTNPEPVDPYWITASTIENEDLGFNSLLAYRDSNTIIYFPEECFS